MIVMVGYHRILLFFLSWYLQESSSLATHSIHRVSSSSSSSSRYDATRNNIPTSRSFRETVFVRVSRNHDESTPSQLGALSDPEEILLRMHLMVGGESIDPNVACSQIIRYIQTFPFAAILPVQPMRYHVTQNGIDVMFLRKKTLEKNSIDGGLQFQVTPVVTSSAGTRSSSSSSSSSTSTSSVDDNHRYGDGKHNMIQVQVTRISEGQSITKVFSEKLLVLAFCDGMFSKKTNNSLTNYVSLWSVFHKWL
jgi:hypothetical protein